MASVDTAVEASEESGVVGSRTASSEAQGEEERGPILVEGTIVGELVGTIVDAPSVTGEGGAKDSDKKSRYRPHLQREQDLPAGNFELASTLQVTSQQLHQALGVAAAAAGASGTSLSEREQLSILDAKLRDAQALNTKLRGALDAQRQSLEERGSPSDVSGPMPLDLAAQIWDALPQNNAPGPLQWIGQPSAATASAVPIASAAPRDELQEMVTRLSQQAESNLQARRLVETKAR